MSTCPVCASTAVTTGHGTWNSHCSACAWQWDDPSLLPSIEIPDSVGEVVAFRAWNIAHTPEGPRLTSQGAGPNAHDVWNPGQVLSAKCNHGQGHRAPDEGCTCGFYAARDRAHLVSLPYHRLTPETVIGKVMIDGKVVPATLGYRGENIWPVEIAVPYHLWTLARDLNEAYSPWGVKVTTDYTHRARAFGEPVETEYCHCGRIKSRAGLCPRHG